MTEAEWAMFTLEIEATFRGGLEEDRDAALREHFGRVEFALARRCIARLVVEGKVFVPTPGELVDTLRTLVPGTFAFPAALRGVDVQTYVAAAYPPRPRLTEGGTA